MKCLSKAELMCPLPRTEIPGPLGRAMCFALFDAGSKMSKDRAHVHPGWVDFS
jgi:hypothetical protein